MSDDERRKFTAIESIAIAPPSPSMSSVLVPPPPPPSSLLLGFVKVLRLLSVLPDGSGSGRTAGGRGEKGWRWRGPIAVSVLVSAADEGVRRLLQSERKAAKFAAACLIWEVVLLFRFGLPWLLIVFVFGWLWLFLFLFLYFNNAKKELKGMYCSHVACSGQASKW